MGSRFPSHQLSNGLYVSGRPEQYKERQPTMTSTAMPYTGGDIKKSGELGKMFDIPVDPSKLKKSGPVTSAPGRATSFGGVASHSGPLPHNVARAGFPKSGPISSSAVPGTGSTRQKSNSGPLNKNGDPVRKTSGPLSGGVTPLVRQTSGPLPPSLPATGLITSGPISSGPLNSSGAPRKVSGPLDTHASGKLHSVSMGNNQFVTNLSHDDVYSFKRSFPKVILWTVIPLFIMGFVAGGFILAAVQNAILLIVVVVIFCAVTLLLIWNTWWGKRAVTGFMSGYPDAELRNAKDGQYVKVSGVVTCGSIPLESSFQKVSRCVYTSSGLYEYRGWSSKPAHAKHRSFTWGLRYLEGKNTRVLHQRITAKQMARERVDVPDHPGDSKPSPMTQPRKTHKGSLLENLVQRHVVDFYISDFQSGLRALVKAGYGAKVTPYVEESTAIEINKSSRDLPSNFIRWLGERNLSSDDRVMRLKEGYIKEGSTVSVMGVVQRNDNVLMIVPPPEPVSTGCQWGKFLLPASLEGLVIRCEDSSKVDAIPV